MTREEKIAWAAGFFEGEGCWSYGERRKDYPTGYLRASVTQKGLNGKELLLRFQNIVEFGKVMKERNSEPNETGMYLWQCGIFGEALLLFNLFEKWLSPRRVNRFKELYEKEKQSRIIFPPRKPGPSSGFKRDPSGKMIRDENGKVVRVNGS